MSRWHLHIAESWFLKSKDLLLWSCEPSFHIHRHDKIVSPPNAYDEEKLVRAFNK
jgi:hypothetical protein